MEISRFRESGGPSARSMMESIVLHTILLALLMLVGASFLARSGAPRTKKEIDIVFYRPAAVPVPPPAVPPPPKAATGEAKARAEAPKGPGKPDLPAGPAKEFSADATPPEPNIGRAGILAFKEQFASLAQDQNAPRLGNDARYAAADEVGNASSHSLLTTNTPGSSGGIDAGSLSRSVGGGGGRRGGGGGMGGPGVQVAGPKRSFTVIGVGGGRPSAQTAPGASRTYKEIEIVIYRDKSAFYRNYNRSL